MADLANFYFTTKYNASSRSRISHLPLLDNISEGALDTIIANLEALSNMGESDVDATPKATVYGVTQQLINIEAIDDAFETEDLESNPLGFDGYMLGDTTGAPAKAKIRQPFTLHGVNENFIVPSGYTTTADSSNVVRQFLTKWGKVRRVVAGALVGKTVTSVVINSVYKMH